MAKRLSSPRASEFFVEVETPKPGSDQGSSRQQRAVTMGAENAPVDFLDEPTPVIDLHLHSNKLVLYMLATVVFLSAFTVVFYIGITVETVYETIGGSGRAEKRVETYNAYSSYAMALVEVLASLTLGKVTPVLEVYVHNAFYYLRGSPTATGQSRARRALHAAILVLFPIILELTASNSLHGLQAAQSSDGFERIMIVDDLLVEESAIDILKANVAAQATASDSLNSVNNTILRNAVFGRSSPFSFLATSPCGQNANGATTADDLAEELDKTERILPLNVHDVDLTSAVYGFVPREWNGEALATAIKPKSSYNLSRQELLSAEIGYKFPAPSDFPLPVAFELLVQGQMVVERLQGDTTTGSYKCSDSDLRYDTAATTTASSTGSGSGSATVSTRYLMEEGFSSYDGEVIDDSENQWFTDNGIRYCEGAESALLAMTGIYDADKPVENVVTSAGSYLSKTLKYLDDNDTVIYLETYEISSQIRLEVVQVDMPIRKTVNYAFNDNCDSNGSGSGSGSGARVDIDLKPECVTDYEYGSLQESFCGSDGCAFVDVSKTFLLEREIGILPYSVNCTLDHKHVHYSADFRAFLPDNCVKVKNSAFLYGVGTYLTGDEYTNGLTPNVTGASVSVSNLRRHVRFSFAKVTWELENLAEQFNATCDNDGDDCNGLWYQLQPSGRFLFAGEEALPTATLEKADFRSPIPLVQLNSPTIQIPTLNMRATLEPLTSNYMKKVQWEPQAAYNDSALGGSDCSVMMDSYLKQVRENHYYLEMPVQPMYTAFFYYFFQDGVVTQLNDTSLLLNKSTAAWKYVPKDRLGNSKLQGDMQERSVRVSIPLKSALATIAGCGLILVLVLVIMNVPVRLYEYFDDSTTVAQQFLAIRDDGAYPASVYTKQIQFPATGETVAFDDVEIEHLTLAHETEPSRLVHL